MLVSVFSSAVTDYISAGHIMDLYSRMHSLFGMYKLLCFGDSCCTSKCSVLQLLDCIVIVFSNASKSLTVPDIILLKVVRETCEFLKIGEKILRWDIDHS